MASLGFDLAFGALSSNVVDSYVGNLSMDGDEYVRCTKCGYGGCDARVNGCGCTLHARCIGLNPSGSLLYCISCGKPSQGLELFPMSFREIDEAHRAANSIPAAKNRRKRKGSGETIDDKSSCLSERRTGRWTTEEMTYCDKLIEKFESGDLPVADGVKLNEFLGNMLKSKQSRLTKKMKNAKLSTKMFQRHSGCLNLNDAREFSALEECFFHSVTDMQERAEIKFHMQKEWREQLSRVCASVGQTLDADSWLSSVEEMDRRASKAKDAARMKKRKLMMGIALRADTKNLEQGVFIEQTDADARAFGMADGDDDKDIENEMIGIFSDDKAIISIDASEKSGLLHSSPFLAKATSYLERHSVPFEHIDLWVPSFVPNDFEPGDQSSCRLCYAGNASVDKLVTEDGKTSRPVSQEEQFNFFAFGDYSQKFSFDVGCGLPGRVYESGRPTWEQSVHNAPDHHFERCGGAMQWGIKTVVGIPIASPNVGRIVVVLYSNFDRTKDEDLVSRLSEEFTRLLPSPKWKLVVDIGNVDDSAHLAVATATISSVADETFVDMRKAHDVNLQVADHSAPLTTSAPVTNDGKDHRIIEVVALLGKYMPSDPMSPHASFVSGFMSLRLLLLRQARSLDEEELVRTMMDSYSSYYSGGREGSDIAVMLARDYMFLSQQQHQHSFLTMNQNLLSGPGQGASIPTAANSGLSLFGLPSIRSSIPNSPTLTPIPAPGSVDGLSIVSN